MKRKISSGINLYQQKEPAFSRDQRQLLTPKKIVLPVPSETSSEYASAFMNELTYLGELNLDYPGITDTAFGQFELKNDIDYNIEEECPLDPEHKKAEISHIKLDKLAEIAKNAHIVDETDNISLYRKLITFGERHITCIVADAIDEEPFVSSNINTLLKKGHQIADILKICAEALSAEKMYSLCYTDIDDTKTIIPSKMGTMRIKKIGGKYPIKNRIGIYLKGEGSVGLIGVQALLHLYRAVYYQKKQTTTIITVAGDCIAYSCNIEVYLGTPVQEVLEFCGLIRDPSRTVINGSMQGLSITNLQLPVLHSTRSVLAFHIPQSIRTFPCINCGKCNQVCPSGLSPLYIYKYAKHGYIKKCKELQAEKCIECSCCSYVCPANLELSDTVAKIKWL